MSYDVGVIFRPGREAPSVDSLDAYFRGRPHYEVEGGSARYANETTGVSFSIDYGTHRGEEGWDPIRIGAVTQASHTRALELVEEVEALVDAFGLDVNDPTMEGMGTGPLDREALMRGCLYASRFGWVVMIAMQQLSDAKVMLYDDERLTAQWRWNRAREETSRATTDSVFVPQISYMAKGRDVLATVTWTGDMPLLLPDVDAIVTLRGGKKGAALQVIPISAIAPMLASIPVQSSPSPHRVLDPLPAALAEAFAAAKPIAPAPTAVAVGSVLGRAFWKQTREFYVAWSGGGTVSSDEKPAKKRAKKPSKTATKTLTRPAKAKSRAAKPKAGKSKAGKPKARTPRPSKSKQAKTTRRR